MKVNGFWSGVLKAIFKITFQNIPPDLLVVLLDLKWWELKLEAITHLPAVARCDAAIERNL